MPLIAVVLLVLAGGGYFMMKGKGGKEAPKAVEMGHYPLILPEIIADMSDGTFVKAEIAVYMEKSVDTKHFESGIMVVREAANDVLRSKTRNEVRSVEGMLKLRREVAKAMNKSLHSLHPEEPSTDKKKKKGKHSEEAHGEDESEIPDGWDSAEGPVLKVVFASFATQ